MAYPASPGCKQWPPAGLHRLSELVLPEAIQTPSAMSSTAVVPSRRTFPMSDCALHFTYITSFHNPTISQQELSSNLQVKRLKEALKSALHVPERI